MNQAAVVSICLCLHRGVPGGVNCRYPQGGLDLYPPVQGPARNPSPHDGAKVPQPQPMTTRDENQSSTSLTHLQEAGNYSEHSSVCACARQRLFAHALCTLLRFGRSYMQAGQSGCGGVALPTEVYTRACAPGVWRSQVVVQILLLPKPNSHSMPCGAPAGNLRKKSPDSWPEAFASFSGMGMVRFSHVSSSCWRCSQQFLTRPGRLLVLLAVILTYPGTLSVV